MESYCHGILLLYNKEDSVTSTSLLGCKFSTTAEMHNLSSVMSGRLSSGDRFSAAAEASTYSSYRSL